MTNIIIVKTMDKIINNLSPSEQISMYLKLRKKFNKEPEYTVDNDKDGYYINCHIGIFRSLRFEKKEFAELAYQIYKNMNHDESLFYNIRSVFRLLNIDSEWAK